MPRERLQSGHRGVGPDEEVRQGRDLGSLPLSVSQEGFPGQERRFERDREPRERLRGKHLLQFLDGRDAD
jgi:hypothetical protein